MGKSQFPNRNSQILEAYLKDLPNAEMYRLDAGHFAVEDHLDYISSHMHRFYAENVANGKKK